MTLIGPPLMNDSKTAPASTTPACVQCGYNLSGIGVHSKCPECGTPIAESLKTPLLSNASPDYLRTLLSGTRLTLIIVLCQSISAVVMFFGRALGGLLGGTNALLAIHDAAEILFAALLFLAYWRISTPDPRDVEDSSVIRIRNVIRYSAGCVFAFAAASFVLSSIGPSSATVTPMISIRISQNLWGLLMLLSSAVLKSAMSIQLHRIGKRVHDQFMIRRAWTYRWILPILATFGLLILGIGAIVGLILYLSMINRLRKHLDSILETGLPASHLKHYSP